MIKSTPLIYERRVSYFTKGFPHGAIKRMMSPSNLGQIVKPFVFLDFIDATNGMIKELGNMPIHPHSGIATVTVLTEGSMHYESFGNKSGIIRYGGVEWLNSGSGVWHGKEMSADNVARITGFQLWLALPPELENGEPESLYIEEKDIKKVGPAHIIIGKYDDIGSPVPSPDGINYLLVTLPAGDRWTYTPPAGHTIGWVALAKGSIDVGSTIHESELAIFENGEIPITMEALGGDDAVFVVGSAVPHPYPLYLGNYSVHTSEKSLREGERRIAELGKELKVAGNRNTSSGTTPVFFEKNLNRRHKKIIHGSN